MSATRWAGATVLVTGASRGIGAAVARAAHRRGARLGLVARSEADLAALADELGADATHAVADVAVRTDVEQAVAEIETALGPIEILVNNAGLGAYRAFVEEELETFERLMAVNYFGTLYATRAVLPSMVERGRGHIVNVASVAGLLGAPFESAYSASKFAVVGLSESLAAEVTGLGVGVSLVNPGPVRTSFTAARGVEFQRDRPRPLDPGAVADAVLSAVEGERFEQILPRWLRFPAIIRAALPGLYHSGLVRDSRREVTALRSRLRRG